MSKLPLFFLASALLCGCASNQPAPVTYSERVSVHSILPVHVRMHEAYDLSSEAIDSAFTFDANDQSHFVESLKSELVSHGIFGSISETGGDGVFEVDVNFFRLSSLPGSAHYKMSVALSTEYRGERDLNRYHVLFMDPDDADEHPVADSKHDASTELMNLIMADIQQAVVDRKVSLRAHVKERRMAIPRVLVKW